MQASVGSREVSSPLQASGVTQQQFHTVELELAPVQQEHWGVGVTEGHFILEQEKIWTQPSS